MMSSSVTTILRQAPGPDDVDAPGSNANVGTFLEADLEGLSIITSSRGEVVMLASSQGDSSFHFYWIRNSRPRPRHLGSFLIDGVGDTDGVHYVPRAARQELSARPPGGAERRGTRAG